MSLMRGAWRGRWAGICLLSALALCWFAFSGRWKSAQSFASVQSNLVPAALKNVAEPLAPLPSIPDALLSRSRTPGAALAWIVDGELDAVHYSGFGSAGAASRGSASVSSGGTGSGSTGVSDAVNSETLFLAGSLGEPVLAMLVMQMVEAGQFDLDLPIGFWLERLPPDADPGIEALTARQILTHTSGLTDVDDRPFALARAPGSSFHYASSGFGLLQYALEAITGRSFSELAHERIFRPLGMNHTRFIWEEPFADRAATGFDRRRQLWPVDARRSTAAASALLTHPEDYGRFVAALLQGWGLSDETYDQWLSPQVELDQDQAYAERLSWALGWGIERQGRQERFWHWSDQEGFTAFVAVDRRTRQAMVLMTNSSTGLSLVEPLWDQSFSGELLATRWAGFDSVEAPLFGIRLRWEALAESAAPQDFVQAIETERSQHPNEVDADLIREWGRSLLHEERLSQARSVLTHNVQLHPRDASGYELLAEVAIRSGDLDDALIRLRRAKQLRPSPSVVRLIDWLEEIAVRLEKPIALQARQLERCVGRYGSFEVQRNLNGALVLIREDEEPAPLIALDESTFVSLDELESRFGFYGDPGRSAEGVEVWDAWGARRDFQRRAGFFWK